jgi:hypothetical protein
MENKTEIRQHALNMFKYIKLIVVAFFQHVFMGANAGLLKIKKTVPDRYLP